MLHALEQALARVVVDARNAILGIAGEPHHRADPVGVALDGQERHRPRTVSVLRTHRHNVSAANTNFYDIKIMADHCKEYSPS